MVASRELILLCMALTSCRKPWMEASSELSTLTGTCNIVGAWLLLAALCAEILALEAEFNVELKLEHSAGFI